MNDSKSSSDQNEEKAPRPYSEVSVSRENRGSLRSLGLLIILGLTPILIYTALPNKSHEEVPVENALRRGKVKVVLTESIDGNETEINIIDLILKRSMSQHGFVIVDQDYDYLLQGSLSCEYYQALTFDFGESSQHLEHQYHGKFTGVLEDSSGKLLQDLSFPEPLMNGRTDNLLAQRDIRRRASTLIASNVVSGQVLGNTEVLGLLDSMTDTLDSRTYNEVVGELVVIGTPAVPYLLDALRDERPVQLAGTYPGFEDLEKDELKIYHVADLALRDILDRDSFLDPGSADDYLHRTRIAWQWEWEDIQRIPENLRIVPEKRQNTVPATKG